MLWRLNVRLKRFQNSETAILYKNLLTWQKVCFLFTITFPTPMPRSMLTTNTILNKRSSSPSSCVLDRRQTHTQIWFWTNSTGSNVPMCTCRGLRLAYGHLILQFVEVVHGRLLSRHVPSVQKCLEREEVIRKIRKYCTYILFGKVCMSESTAPPVLLPPQGCPALGAAAGTQG